MKTREEMSAMQNVLLALLAVVSLTTGCLTKPIVEDTGKLWITASIPAVLLAQGLSAESVLEDVDLKEIVFTVSNGSASYTKTTSAESTEDTADAAFHDLPAGTWTVHVVAIDDDAIAIAEGSATASVGVGMTTSENVNLNVLPGTLVVNLTAPSDSRIASGTVSLLVSSHERRFDITPDGGKTIDFGEVAAQVWLINAEFFNSSADRLYAGQSQVAVLPGRTSTVQVEFDHEAPGGLSITVNWNLPPDKPTGVSASYANGRVSVTWADDGAAGYMVIRGLTEDGHGVALTDSPIAKTAWVDDYDFEPGQTYWYRVIAYDDANVSSHFSDAVSVAIPAVQSGVVSYYGKMVVKGNRIHGAQTMEPMQVRGMSFFWSNWSEQFWTTEVVNRMVDEFQCEVLRAAYGVNDVGTPYRSSDEHLVRDVVNAAIERDVYVIIDWHTHGGEHNVQAAKDFFARMAQDYGSYEHVIFEIYNEPLQVPWPEIKQYAEEIIPLIREHSDNLIIVGTPTWSQDVNLAADDPITSAENIAYGLHFYAGTHGDSLRAKADYAMNQGAALFVSEWGTVNADGDGNVDFQSSSDWLLWMDQNQLSWCNWAINDKLEGASFFRADGGLTTSGAYIKGVLEDAAAEAEWRR